VYWAPNQQTSFSVAKDPELAHTLLKAAVNLLERIEVIMADDPQGWLEEAEKGRERRDRDWMRAVADYRTAKAEADAATQELAQAKAKLEELSEGADSHGYRLTLRWISRRGNVDWTKVSKDFELTPKTLDQYRKEPSIFSRIVED
jgi:hypothetical protein